MHLFTLENLIYLLAGILYLLAFGLAFVFSRRASSNFTSRSRKLFIVIVGLGFLWFISDVVTNKLPLEFRLVGARWMLATTCILTVYEAAFFNSAFVKFLFVSRKNERLLFLVGTLMSLACLSAFVVTNYIPGQPGIAREQFVFGGAFLLYSLWLLATIFVTVVMLLKYRKFKEIVHQNKWLFLFWGYVVTLILIGITMIMSIVTARPDAGVVFSPFILLIFIYICLYSMDASKIMDIGFALDIGARYFMVTVGIVLFIIATQIFGAIFPDYQIIIAVFAGVFLVLAVHTIAGFIEPYAKYEKDIRGFINKISIEPDLSKVLVEIKKIIGTVVQAKEVSFVIFNKNKDLVTYQFIKKGSVETSENRNELYEMIAEYWNRDGVDTYVQNEMDFVGRNETPRMAITELMTKHMTSLVLPLNKKAPVTGAVMLGPKNNHVEYTRNDVDLLEEIMQFSSVAISRALLYQETSSFAQKLSVKVKERTRALLETQTDLESKNMQLRTAYHELKTLDNAKSEFISIASHQLRTPISIIRGYVSMILEGDFGIVPEEQKLALGKAAGNIQQLNDIVEDILNASRIERGKLVITLEAIDIIALVKTVITALQPKADRKKLTLDFDSKIKIFDAKVDRNKIYEVIMNLVDNALNYTEKGGVIVSCELPKDDSEALIVSVKDTGIGIPEEFKEKMFRRFSRSENAKAIRPDGTGIGLYVAKSFVDAHKGELWFESTLGKGTTFFVKLHKDPKIEGEQETGATK